MEEFKGKLRLVLKNYPYKYRDYSHFAAEALLAAGDQGKYWEMHDIMLERSPVLAPENLEKYAEELGLNAEKFKSDLEMMKHKDQIEQDKELAKSLDIYNTPTFFINGRKIIGNPPYKYLREIIEKELARVEEKKAFCSNCHRSLSAGD
jgi:protein-disulfide isomerase